MARVDPAPSKSACVGLFSGMLLLGFAGTLVVMSPSSLVVDLQRSGSNSLRRLSILDEQTVVVNTLTNEVVAVSTTRPSFLDSADTSAGSGSSATSLEGSKSLEPTSFRTMPVGLEDIWGILSSQSITVLCQLAVSLCFAALYHKNAVAPILLQGTMVARYGSGYGGYRKDDFDVGICGCTGDLWVCIHGLCCPLVRMSHTNAVAGILGFWQTALLWCCCSTFTGGIGPCCLMVYWRKQLKEIMGIEDHIFFDILVTCFCPWLSVCQQGTAVDQAMGYEVTGCCTLDTADPHTGDFY